MNQSLIAQVHRTDVNGQEAVAALCEASGAELVQTIGKIAVILRRAKKPNPKLSNLLRQKH